MSRIFGKICQNGYVVRDIDAAMKHWTEVLGVGPFYYIERVKMDWFRYRGEASDAEVSIALANSGDLQIELIQQRNDAPSMYRDFLSSGREGLQHMSYWTRNYRPISTALSLWASRSGRRVRSADRTGALSTSTPKPIQVPSSKCPTSLAAKAAFFERIRQAAANWDGTRAIRPVR